MTLEHGLGDDDSLKQKCNLRFMFLNKLITCRDIKELKHFKHSILRLKSSRLSEKLFHPHYKVELIPLDFENIFLF